MMNKKETSIVFTGDIGFDRYMDKRWEDENLLSKPVLGFFHSQTTPSPTWRAPSLTPWTTAPAVCSSMP